MQTPVFLKGRQYDEKDHDDSWRRLCCCCPPRMREENDLLARIRQKGEIVVATRGRVGAVDVSRRERHSWSGFDVEVAQAIAAKLGVTAKFVETEWDGIFAGLDARPL